MKKRARGKAYECACGEEKLRLTRERGVEARVDRWGYLFGECGGGVKLRFDGARVVEHKTVDEKEANRVRSLPAPRLDAYARAIQGVDERARRRLDEIVVGIREAIQEGTEKWIAVGQLLCEAKKLLKHGDFGVWVERNGMDRHNAQRFMTAYEMTRALPAFSSTLRKMGQEKLGLLARLPEAKRLEVLEDGIAVNGGAPISADRITYRQMHLFVRSIVGKSTRGRKPKPKDADAPTERFGLPIEIFDAFQSALKGLKALQKFARAGWDAKQRPAAAKLWTNVNRLFYELQDDLKMADLLRGRVIEGEGGVIRGGSA